MPNKARQVVRVALFVLLLLLSPFAVILCGFCSCLVGVSAVDSQEVAFGGFGVGLLGGTLFAFYLLFVLYRKWFVEPSTSLEDASHD